MIGILSLAFFAQGMAALGWTLVSDIAPKNLLGLTGGIFNFLVVAGVVFAVATVLARRRYARSAEPQYPAAAPRRRSRASARW